MSATPPLPEPEERLSGAWRFVQPANAVTYVSLAAAGLSIHAAATGALHLMAALWALSAIADNVDGAFARLFPRSATEREFGQELDTLVDAVAFGLAPVAGLRLVWAPTSSWDAALFALAAFWYLLALITRLGHFNIAHRRGHTAFTGVPSTEAALALATFLLVPHAGGYAWAALAVLGVLMVAPIPIPRPRGLGQALLVLWLLAVPVAHLVMHGGAR